MRDRTQKYMRHNSSTKNICDTTQVNCMRHNSSTKQYMRQNSSNNICDTILVQNNNCDTAQVKM